MWGRSKKHVELEIAGPVKELQELSDLHSRCSQYVDKYFKLYASLQGQSELLSEELSYHDKALSIQRLLNVPALLGLISLYDEFTDDDLELYHPDTTDRWGKRNIFLLSNPQHQWEMEYGKIADVIEEHRKGKRSLYIYPYVMKASLAHVSAETKTLAEPYKDKMGAYRFPDNKLDDLLNICEKVEQDQEAWRETRELAILYAETPKLMQTWIEQLQAAQATMINDCMVEITIRLGMVPEEV